MKTESSWTPVDCDTTVLYYNGITNPHCQPHLAAVKSFENCSDGDTSLQLALTSILWRTVFLWESFDCLQFRINVTDLTSLVGPVVPVTGYRLTV
jgi:hypothetical protein